MRIILALLLVAAGCGSGQAGSAPPSPPPARLDLKPGHYVFHVGKEVAVGTRLICHADGSTAGGGSVQPLGRGVGSSIGFSAETFQNGKVVVICPAHPSPM
jgi:hypothetical protein